MESNLRIAICDDEERMADITKSRVENLLEELEITDYELHVYHSGMELVKWEKIPDLLLLDIDMPKITGFQVMETFVTLEHEPLVIFLTGHEGYALEGYNYRPFGFLIKTMDDEKFKKEVGQAIKKIRTFEKVMLKGDDGNYFIINMHDITHIKAYASESQVCLRKREIVDTKTLKMWEESLPKDLFLPVNRSCLINLNYLAEIQKDTVILANNERLSLSRRRKKGLEDAYRKFIRLKGRGVL